MSAPAKERRGRVTLTPPSIVDGGEAVQLEPGVWEVPDEVEGSRVEERAPKIPTPTVSEQVDNARETVARARERLRNMVPVRKTSRGGVKRPRRSVEGLISSVWSLGARVASALPMPNSWAVANVLAMQSPVAGKILEPVVKDTVADALLQPFARVAQGGQVTLALLGPPVLVAVAAAKPDSQPIVEPLLREALKAWLQVAGPAMIEKAKEEAEFQAEYGETIDGMIKAIFTPPPGVVPDDGSSGANN